MKRDLLFGFLFFTGAMLCTTSCSDDAKPTFPLSAEIFHSVKGKQVAFTALTHGATTWSWDFGDGQTSTEQNPVHVYEEGGYYHVSLTVTDGGGGSLKKEVKLPPFALTPYAYLVGDHTSENYQGKTWRLAKSHNAEGDYFANADASLSVYDDTPVPLPEGIFTKQFEMGDIYNDEFTFFEDGRYVHDVKEDGGTFGGLVYALTQGVEIINDNGKDYGLCIAEYTPEPDATFTLVENENFTVSSVYGPGGMLRYDNVMTLDFSGNEFIGFRDFQRKVIVKSISGNRMQLVMFMAAGDGDSAPIGVNTHALILSLEAVN